MTTPELLTLAGWKPLPDGRWLSPLTQRAYDERTAILLAKLPTGVETLRSLEQRKQRHQIYRRR